MATKRPTGCQSPAPALSQVNRHLLVNPAKYQLQMAPMTPFDTIICQLQMAPMTPFDTIIWPIFPKGNRPMSRPQKSTSCPNREKLSPTQLQYPATTYCCLKTLLTSRSYIIVLTRLSTRKQTPGLNNGHFDPPSQLVSQ